MLIIKYPDKKDDISNFVYSKTLEYIAKNSSSAEIYNYETDQELLDFIKKIIFAQLLPLEKYRIRPVF